MSDVFHCWHGTTKNSAESILINGFNKMTYFSAHLEDAVGYGGQYVFRVEFPAEYFKDFEEQKPCWQFRSPIAISVEQIVDLTNYNPKELYKKE